MLPRLGILPRNGSKRGDDRVSTGSPWSRLLSQKHTKQLVLDITRLMPRGALLDSIDDTLFAKLLIENMRTRREMRLRIDLDIKQIVEESSFE